MIKPAVGQTKTAKIIVCATPATLASVRYVSLKKDYASGITVLEPNCSDWSSLIEANEITEEKIRNTIEPGLHAGADVIVLACTHYHWIEDTIADIAKGCATILQPEHAVIERLSAFKVP